MLNATVLTLVDGVRVVVPDSVDLITPYVLREQQDFFEDELRFVRRLLQPGQKAIDIGANYGVYTLPMAQKVGPNGHVWAFEPASGTAHYLAQSIAANGFGHVTLKQQAVSNVSGGAQLALQRHTELNSIIHGPVGAGDSETVPLVTLDECMDCYSWADIEFIKIDAEGEEPNIIEGGLGFFANLAPLVQYELRTNATNMNFDLTHDFMALGYDSYRLLPGLNLLIPFRVESRPDSYLLNLFCCKAARADRLAEQGVLLRSADLAATAIDMSAAWSRGGDYHWRHTLAHLPYAAPFVHEWNRAEKSGDSTDIDQALSLYARSRDAALPTAERFRALEASFLRLKALCERQASRLRLASLARVAHDYGERATGVNALTQLLEDIRRAGLVDPSEPFLAPLERFESIVPGETVSHWLIAAVLEQLERREWFSSFYAGPNARERLEDIHALGLGSPEMERRLNLVRQRYGRTGPEEHG